MTPIKKLFTQISQLFENCSTFWMLALYRWLVSTPLLLSISWLFIKMLMKTPRFAQLALVLAGADFWPRWKFQNTQPHLQNYFGLFSLVLDSPLACSFLSMHFSCCLSILCLACPFHLLPLSCLLAIRSDEYVQCCISEFLPRRTEEMPT